jgi:hypothetical protein
MIEGSYFLKINLSPLFSSVLKRHLIQSGENIIKMIVPTLPKFADIDPFVEYIGRDFIDNN